MPEPYKDMAPILDMFTALIRSPKVAQILKNWKESLRKGMLHFGTKERLNPELTFNLLIYQHLSSIMPSSVAVILSILARLWMTLIEIGLIGMVYLVEKFRKRLKGRRPYVST